jgi:hypothetical protein
LYPNHQIQFSGKESSRARGPADGFGRGKPVYGTFILLGLPTADPRSGVAISFWQSHHLTFVVFFLLTLPWFASAWQWLVAAR